jgi:preprotein translocase subunit YajC
MSTEIITAILTPIVIFGIFAYYILRKDKN